MQNIDAIEFGITLPLETWLAILLFRRGLHRHFPFFVVYFLAELTSTIARWLTLGHYSWYFYVYWTSNAALAVLGLLALHEVFRSVYQGFYLLWWFRVAYYGTIAFVLAVAVRNAIIHPPMQTYPVIGLIIDAGLAVNILRAGMVALYGFLGGVLNVGFPRYPSGIAVGFLASSIGQFAGYWARSEFGTRLQSFFSYASFVAYLCGLGIWLYAFMRPEADEKDWKPPMAPEEMLRMARSYLGVMGISRKDNAR
jgi:hypothetical protein